MDDEQHDDHCLLTLEDRDWRIKGVKFPALTIACPCGCTGGFLVFAPDFQFDAYCDQAAMELRALSLRAERGSIPVASGSEARN